ncbi:MAG: hypothetical protein LBI87_06065 [Candidatus Accumulibacter sp.]|jgi:uncharacterized membrane protein|nr:hypothetical protein [Accumulibacter sp.]
MNSFPIPAPAFDGRGRAVAAGAVFAWLRFGWNVFMASPGLWAASAAILIAGFLALMFVWLIGPLLAGLLAPVLAAGLLGMCRKAADEKRLALSDLMEGFTGRAAPLMLLGVIFMLASLAIELVAVALFGGSVAGGLMLSGAAGLGLMLGGSILALLLSSLLAIPLWMAMWFAPALVLFSGVSPVEACKASFAACLKNVLPFVILGLVVFVLCFFAMLPAGLGFLVLIPVLAGTAYASWQDVFVVH